MYLVVPFILGLYYYYKFINVECNDDIVKLITDSLHKVLTELNLVELILKLENLVKKKNIIFIQNLVTYY